MVFRNDISLVLIAVSLLEMETFSFPYSAIVADSDLTLRDGRAIR